MPLMSSATGAPVPEADFACPMMSLPLAFGTRLDTVPAAVPYLAAPEERRARWRARLGAGVPGRRRVLGRERLRGRRRLPGRRPRERRVLGWRCRRR
jgi:hypothetical protein